MYLFKGRTADDVWVAIAAAVSAGQGRRQPGRVAATEELLHVGLEIHDPRQRWVSSRRPAMNPAFALAEVIWILGGHRDSAYLNYWNKRMPEFAGSGQSYHGAYGFRLRHQFGLDQIERAARALATNSTTRQVVLQIWDARVDLPSDEGLPADPDIPCNVASLLKVRDGRLEWLQVIRSNDLFLGLPHNIVQFTSLQEIVAGWLGLEPGSYNQLSDSLHVYEHDLDKIVHMPDFPPILNTDSLACPWQESTDALRELDVRSREMIDPNVDHHSLTEILASCRVPSSYRNVLIVLAAEVARKRGWFLLSDELISQCTNQGLAHMWFAWRQRMSQLGSQVGAQ